MKFLSFCLSLLASASLWANAYTIQLESKNSVEVTVEKFLNIIKEKKLTLFADIDHQSNARKAGLKMKKSRVIIFGNPKMGTVLMNENPAIAIELPLKVSVYENAQGKVILQYYNPQFFVEKYGIKNTNVINTMTNALRGLTAFAIGKI